MTVSPVEVTRSTGPLRELTTKRKAAIVLVLVVVAYHYSLSTLMRNLGVETPLAYLGLVPVIALLLVAARARPIGDEPDIHDRQLDFIVGVPLVVSALVVALVMPARLSTMFWIWRLDLLSLPLFTAGVVSIVFGVRALWRLRFPIGFLLLAWPLPYTVFVTNWLQSFTNLTVAGLKFAVQFVPIARWTAGSDGSLFALGQGSGEFVVSVAAACSGVNGMLGFLLAGTAFASLVRGRVRPKVAWLASGLVLLWLLNVGRILVIFAVGSAWGERVAVDGLHPYIGLVVFCVGILLMIKALPLFGLDITKAPPAAGAVPAAVFGPRPAGPHVGGGHSDRRPAAPRSRLALSIVVAASLILGLANRDLRQYELVASDLGEPRLDAFSVRPPAPQAWTASLSDTYAWATRFFGDDSTWQRYLYSGGGGDLRSSAPVIADVVTTSDLGSFTTYGLEACYNFHGYRIYDTRSVDLGGGVTGEVVSHYNSSVESDWTSLYWIWPVATAEGTRYERVVLMMINSADAQYSLPDAGPSLTRGLGLGANSRLRGDEGVGSTDPQLTQTQDFLIAFSRDVVAKQAAATPPPP